MITYTQLLEKLSGSDITRARNIVGKDVFDANEGERHTTELQHSANPDVEEHLKKNGFDTTSISKGTVKDKHGREVGVGRALSKTKAPEELLQKNAKAQQGSKLTGDLHVVTSTKPKDVAGMTSGTAWENESCMNVADGCNRHYLKNDVEHKTKVHFLTHKDDKDIEHPIARALSKKFVGKLPDGSEHTIYRRDNKTYGKSSSAFEHTVDKENAEKYPSHPDVKEYNLHHGLYNNGTGKNLNHDWYKKHIHDKDLSVDDVNAAANHSDPEVAKAALNHPKSDTDTTKLAANHSDPEVVKAALNHPKSDTDTTIIAARHSDPEVRKMVADRLGK